jgi:O-antigen/teichoic acid export membrane protein
MAGKLVFRGISIISTLVLVRLLSPEDFGIMAISTMVIGLFAVLSSAGINRYIVMYDSPSEDIYNKAFTLNIILRFVAFLMVSSIAYFIAEQMGNDALTLVIIMTAGASFLAAFRNIGLIRLEKELDFAPINKILVIAKVISTVVTLSLALVYRSYMALVIGTITIEVVTVILSYIYASYRPRLNFHFDKKMFSFSSFLLFRNIIAYSRSQVDVLLVGKKFGDEALGGFSIARQFAILPQTEIVAPAMQPAFSALSAMNKSPNVLRHKICQTLFSTYLLLVPAAAGLYLLAKPFVLVVLGENWLSVADYIGILAFLMIPFVTQAVLNIAYDNMGKTKLSFIVDLFGLAAIITTFMVLIPTSVEQFSTIRVLVGFCSLGLAVLFAKLFLKIKFRYFLKILSLPMIGAMVMAVVLYQLLTLIESPIVSLFLFSAVGVIIYTLCILLYIFIMLRIGSRSWLLNLFPTALFYHLKTKLKWDIPNHLLTVN